MEQGAITTLVPGSKVRVFVTSRVLQILTTLESVVAISNSTIKNEVMSEGVFRWKVLLDRPLGAKTVAHATHGVTIHCFLCTDDRETFNKNNTQAHSISAPPPHARTFCLSDMSRRLGVESVRAVTLDTSYVFSATEAKCLPALGKLSLASPSTGRSVAVVGVKGAEVGSYSEDDDECPIAHLEALQSQLRSKLKSLKQTATPLLFSFLGDLPDDIEVFVAMHVANKV